MGVRVADENGRRLGGFLEEASGCPGSSLSWLGVCPTPCASGSFRCHRLTLLTQEGACFPPLTLPDSDPHEPVPLGWPPWQKGGKGPVSGELNPSVRTESSPGPHEATAEVLTSHHRPGFLSPLTAAVLVEVTQSRCYYTA